ncbi:hypothetical protein [Portibacter lacus]|uniref:Phosphoribosylanthranilate isomerase n=1 Tax=Portibacter lacus TaxID=1099794 RepID=A0AA37SVQ3_9BACT|nr:hypothetical protein [Portibacter lacus]GLR18993.1 hypothetical protein GCM10007940_36090 [Portibacter lacus]
MLKTKVIASSVSNLTDARYFAAWGVDFMGFDLNVVSIPQANAFKNWISGPEIIGEFSSVDSFDQISSASEEIGLDYIQLDPLCPADWVFDKPTIREIILENGIPGPGTYILRSENPAFDLENEMDRIKEICAASTCYLDLNIAPDEYEHVLTTVKPEGIVLRGGEEDKVGFKSFDELDEIMEVLEID